MMLIYSHNDNDNADAEEVDLCSVSSHGFAYDAAKKVRHRIFPKLIILGGPEFIILGGPEFTILGGP